ncbi:MAG: tetratricopeptide repeat protein, partial [Sedimentisphaerales bacterium]|nr:tetratricopeptide repeat protein [Sedimentisphaerales bacterium]
GQYREALDAYEQVNREHPEDVVAKNGRAEILKALGCYKESRDLYEKVFQQHQENSYARYGLASVLTIQKRYNDALVLIPSQPPLTRSDWIGQHIKGMIYLYQGEVDEAIHIFEYGVENDPLPASREYFQTALAIALCRKKEYSSAYQTLESVRLPELQTVSDVIRIHALGRQGNCDKSAKIYERLPNRPGTLFEEVKEETYLQNVAFRTSKHDENWLIEKETELLLAA